MQKKTRTYLNIFQYKNSVNLNRHDAYDRKSK